MYPNQKRIVIGLHAIVLVLLALHLYVRVLPPTPQPIPAPGDAESAWWGLWPATAVPVWAAWLGAALVMAALALSWRLRIGSASWPLIVITLLLILSFFLFPIAHTRWGDAYMLSRGLAWPDPTLRITHSWQAPVDVFVHSQMWLILGERLGWQDATPVYRLLSPLAGALYLAVLLALTRLTWLAPGWLSYGLLATLGLMQLFYGYVENYSFAAAGVMAYLWMGLLAVEGRNRLWAAATILAVTNALHPSTIVLAPTLLYLGGREWRRGNISALSAVLQIALPMAVVGGTVFAWMEMSGHGLQALMYTDRPGGGDARWFVPLWTATTRWEHYTMFSWPHLRDFLNEQLLVAPAALPAILWLVGNRLWLRRTHRGHTTARELDSPLIFLAIGAVCYLFFAWVWNPDYGGQRDWDLFSLASLPTTLLLVALLPRTLPQRQMLTAGAFPLIVVQALHTFAWIYSNTLPWEWPG